MTISKQLVVICGPSGVGRGTIVDMLLRNHSNDIARAISHTTRLKKDKEVDGEKYHFINEDLFKKRMLEDNYFIEHLKTKNVYYGTSIDSIKDVIEKKQKICLVESSIEGHRKLKDKYSTSLPFYSVAIVPESMRKLENHTRDKKTVPGHLLGRYLENANETLKYCLNENNGFDKVIRNHNSAAHGYPALAKFLNHAFPGKFVEKPQPKPKAIIKKLESSAENKSAKN